MKRIATLVLLILLAVSAYGKVTNVKKEFSKSEIREMTKRWYEKHPDSKPHWLEEGEKEMMESYLRAFYVTDPPTGTPRATAEFEPMEGVVIRYPFGIPMSLIKEMAEDSKVVTIVSSSSQQSTVLSQYQSNSVNTDNCEFLIAPTDSYWTRDYAAWYAAIDDQELSVVNFPYNRPRPNDNDVPIAMATYLGLDLYGMEVVQTGGNYMTDGMGIAASTTIVYTESQSELGISSDEVDQRMLDYLGITQYHVVEDPNNTYIDHIDCWGKFLDVDKILIREVPESHPQHDEIEEVVEYFASQTSSYGSPYEIYRVWSPNEEPYTNSLILNNKVMVPIMGGSNDAAALEVYENAMPGYEIHGFVAGPEAWQGTDALHCRTRGIADREMLYIRHMAKSGILELGSDIEIEAKITSYGSHTISDSDTKLFYTVNGGDEQSVVMSKSGNIYTATIPEQTEGSKIEYYIQSKDDSGRVSNHPYIGAPDPHIFYAGAIYQPNIDIDLDAISVEHTSTTSTTEPLTISNSGEIELNYNIETEIYAFEEFQQPIENSPAGSSYSSNTLTESNWTEFDISETGELSSLLVNYTWVTDTYPAEGSFHIQTPAGTEVIIASAQNSGTYEALLENISGEEVNGTWKLWIEDSYGDGGHQATDINLTFRKNIEISEWLSVDNNSGSIAPNGSTVINVGINSAGLESGNYSGMIKISSNDNDTPQIDIPVSLELGTVSIEENLAADISLVGNYPNPFNPETTINFSLTSSAIVEMSVYNSKGEMVTKVDPKQFNAGRNSFKFDGSSFNSGVYFYTIKSGNKAITKKMLLVK